LSPSPGRLIIPPEDNAMSDNPTQQIPDSRSFEERVFARFDTLDVRITTLEEKVDSRLRETRPIWEAMQADLANVKDDMTKVRGDVKEIKYTLKAMHKESLRVRTDQVEMDERIEKLESQSTR
jgi:uncharacterized coiled-coil protein SlyX